MLQQSWMETDLYVVPVRFPSQLLPEAGPRGSAYVPVWSDGSTASGWSEKHFMSHYTADRFSPAKLALNVPVALVMRSVRAICIDIDGKNDGFKNIGKLGMLPPTLAETSKGGNGLHLFYRTEQDIWDPKLGYAQFRDRISIVPGVDIRATGCVYRYAHQRWNHRQLADAPTFLQQKLLEDQNRADHQISAIIKILDSQDETEVLMMKDQLLEDLKKDIPPGRRNNTLFAIGNQLRLVGVSNWADLIEQRAQQVKLDRRETSKLIANIEKYGDGDV